MEFRTSDLYLAAFLKAKGHALSWEHKGRCIFIFNGDTQVDRENFINGGNVDVSLFISAIQSLKTLIFKRS